MVKQPRLSAIQLLSGGFITIILLGTGLLMLPIAAKNGQVTHFIDALFTATSATCVTGLITLNTAAHWTIFGQLIILVLIEIGGLGFMSFTMLLFLITKRRIGLSMRIMLKESMNLNDTAGTVKFIAYVIKLCAAIQIIGTCLLFVDFYPKYGFWKGLYFSVFHAISAFCNAGFDIMGTSLEQAQNDPYLIVVISVLIIAGGLGFLVWRDLLHYHQTHRLSLHTKLALTVTAVLLFGGFLIFLISEQNLKQLSATVSPFNRVVNTFFLAVTPRTAGFNSINYADISKAGLVLSMFLMYIGGTSGSTAGGLKTTTIGVLVAEAVAVFRGKQKAQFCNRSISEQQVRRAYLLLFMTISLCVVSIIVLSITESIPSQYGIEYVAFEVFSAFGTVGMTMGLTPHLTIIGKLIIIALMFIGRVGLYTVLFSMINRSTNQQEKFHYPTENVLIG